MVKWQTRSRIGLFRIAMQSRVHAYYRSSNPITISKTLPREKLFYHPLCASSCFVGSWSKSRNDWLHHLLHTQTNANVSLPFFSLIFDAANVNGHLCVAEINSFVTEGIRASVNRWTHGITCYPTCQGFYGACRWRWARPRNSCVGVLQLPLRYICIFRHKRFHDQVQGVCMALSIHWEEVHINHIENSWLEPYSCVIH